MLSDSKLRETLATSIRRHRNATAAALAAISWFAPAPALAADLKPETLQQWEEYAKTVDARNQEHLAAGVSFLVSDEIPGQAARIRGGEIVVWPAGKYVPMKVSSGLIHDWIGAAFIPNTGLKEVLPVVRDYDRYKDFYRPSVIHSKSVATTDSKDQFSIVIVSKSVVVKTALDSDYQSLYTRLNDRRWYSVSETTRVQEIAGYDTPSQHMLPEDHGTGLIWRLHTITRFEERDGGVYIELEAVALSRDIPAALHWIIDPIVRSTARSSLSTSLRQTGSAVHMYSTAVDEAACVGTNQCATGDKAPAAAPARSFR